MSEPKDLDYTKLKVSDINFLENNPNEMSDVDFNDLVRSIENTGFDQPITVYKQEGDDNYTVLKGNHRLKAAMYVGMDEIPVTIQEFEHGDQATATALADNIVRGDINPEIFTQEYNRLKKEHGKQKTMEMMNISTDDQLQQFIKDVRKSLPDEMKEKFDDVKDEIDTIDDLSQILNRIFNEHGESLELNYMVFSYGNEDHLYVQCDKELWQEAKSMVSEANDKDIDINEVFRSRLLD